MNSIYNNETGDHLSVPSSIASGGGGSVRSSHTRRTARRIAEDESEDCGSLLAPTRLASSPSLSLEDISAGNMDAPPLDDYQVPVGGVSSRTMSSASMNLKGLSKMAIGIPVENNHKFTMSTNMEVEEPSSTFLASDAAHAAPSAETASAASASRTPEVSPTTNPKGSVRISLRNVGTARSPTTAAAARQSARDFQSKAAGVAARNSALSSGDANVRPGAVAVAVRNSENSTVSATAASAATSSPLNRNPASATASGSGGVIRGDAEVKAAVMAASPSEAVTRPGAVAVRNDDKPSSTNSGNNEKSLAPARPAPSRLELAPPTEADSFLEDVQAAAMMKPSAVEAKVSEYAVPTASRSASSTTTRGNREQNEITVSSSQQPGVVQSRVPSHSIDNNNYEKSDDSLKISSSYDDGHKASGNIPSLSYDHAGLPTAIEAHIVDEERGNDAAKNGGHDETLVVAIGEHDTCWAFFKRSRSLQIGAFLGCFVIVGAVIGLVLTSFNKSITTEDVGKGPTVDGPEEEPFFDLIGPFIDGPIKIGAEHGSSISLSEDGTRMAVADDADVYIYDLIEVEATGNDASGKDGRTAYDWVWVSTIEARDIYIVSQYTHTHDMVRTAVQVDLSKDGNFIAVGYPYSAGVNGTKPSTGCVQVYRALDHVIDDESMFVWQQLGDTMYGWSEADFFGTAVSLSASGGIVAVGAPGNDGHADIFILNVDTWVKQGNFVALDGTLEAGSVSMDANGQTFAVGGHPVSPDSNDAAVVRIFRFIAGDWEELGDGIVGDIQNTAYIAELSADGNIVAVSNYYRGAAGPAEGGTNDALDVRAFEWDGRTNQWIQLGENLHTFAPGDKAGYFISLSDDGKLMAMGDPGREDKDGGGVTGHAHIYQYDDESDLWLQRGPNENGESPGDQFGFAVALSGDGTHFAVGAPFNRGDGREKGRVYVYDIVL